MMAWDSNDTALTVSGIGSMLGAWGTYKSNKDALEYEKSKDAKAEARDALAMAKVDEAQLNLEDAFDTSALTPKKKKKKTTTTFADLELPTTTV